jgi:hypothetical protein
VFIVMTASILNDGKSMLAEKVEDPLWKRRERQDRDEDSQQIAENRQQRIQQSSQEDLASSAATAGTLSAAISVDHHLRRHRLQRRLLRLLPH